MDNTVVLFPSSGVGHLAPMTEFAKLLVSHGLSVSIVVLPPFSPFSTASSVNNFISAVTSHPSITFHHLPPIPVSHSPLPTSKPSRSPLLPLFLFLRAVNPYLRDLLRSISQTSKIRAILLDFFCTEALHVAAEIQIPAYIFSASSSFIIAYFLYLPTLYNEITEHFQDLGETPIHFPGMPPIPASHLPSAVQMHDDIYRTYVNYLARLPESKGIVINSFEYLESRTLKTISQGLCLQGRVTPPVHCVGPLITGRAAAERHDCLAWLDKQPKGSVVFLCFGSMGRFPAEQIKEIAIGLERSEQRFLWVVRSPLDTENMFRSAGDADLDSLLPAGFGDRTEGRGMVVKDWAPQVEVLNHEATGGFVTHCGWNSVLEAVCAGVGMIAWPLYAEQKMNKVVLVEEMKLAVEMKGYDKGMVTAKEVETRVRWFMESDGGTELRERAKEMKDRAAAAVSDGGSSHATVVKLTGEWKKVLADIVQIQCG
ncbi:UDP-glycosyltransferase 88A1-like [Dioscorea cayenensis subsp. rotundata]|uniref:UDP-glycosyltransferase 88A1-like n=1 Tax=Dioscorea cayennensis subsp. rotundata TaxID=55577 RepID=A0AB40ALT3_DIOCR|nr:UDP-glycosyltransferase 88A1-like [Dioscorea cayenensis subsp. rotundata]